MLAHKLGIKGTTVYRDTCREGVLTKISDDDTEMDESELFELFEQNKDKVIIGGIKPPKKSYLKKTKIKTNTKKKYYFMVGYVTKQMKKPYEFFITTNHHEKNDVTNDLVATMCDFLVSKNIEAELINDLKEKMEKQNNVDKIARLISMSLRHNINIIEVANILEKYTEQISSLIF